jgi:hypothetical protein
VTRIGRSIGSSLVAPALLLHCAAWFAMLAHGDTWWGGWGFAVEQAAGSVVIVGPLLAALTANVYARRRETSLPLLVVSSLHPVRGWFAPAARLWLLAIANLLLLLAEIAVVVALAGPPLLVGSLLVLPFCVLMLGVHALIGMAIGLQLGPRLAGAVAGTVSFGLFMLTVANLAPAAFVTGGETADLVGTRYRLSVLTVLAITAIAIAVGVAATSWWPGPAARARLLVAITSFALATVLSQSDVVDLDRRFEPVQMSLRCGGSAPEVCVPADTPRVLPAASRGMRRLIGPLRAAGAQLPQRWVDYWGQRPDPRVGMLALRSGAELGTRVAEADLVRSLTMPATCAGYFDDRDTQRSLDVRLLLERWIAFRNQLGNTSGARPWFSSPESEEWVRSTYAKLRRCDLDGLRFPVGGP